jgi:hypothetical protein
MGLQEEREEGRAQEERKVLVQGGTMIGGFVMLSEQVFVPVHRIERISFFADYAIVKYVDDRQVDRIDGEDAQRLRSIMHGVL